MLNKALLIGNLGNEPELKYTQSGAAVCEFSIATTKNWKDNTGTKQEHTEWHRIAVWGKRAETCGQYLSKGKQVYVEGEIKTQKWQDKDGKDRYTTSIQAYDVKFLSSNKETNDSLKEVHNKKDNYQAVSTNTDFTHDTLPF